ncbi:MAG: hypothetical protein L0211_15615 [Planctomycetaceae bacterium]|nr:hypothetical protein [Planctomycetaceae bacterium]
MQIAKQELQIGWPFPLISRPAGIHSLGQPQARFAWGILVAVQPLWNPMLNWLRSKFVAYLWRYIERQLRKLLETGDYETVLKICQKRENDVRAQYWQALALLWLERYQEALDIADRLERLQAAGAVNLKDGWIVAFAEIKCGALSGLTQHEALHEFSSRCLERHPGNIPLTSFQILAALHLDRLTASTPGLHFLDCSTNRFDEAWHFTTLCSAQRYLRNEERASEIVRLALAKYPDDDAVREMARKAKCVTAGAVSPCVRPRDLRRCGPKAIK